MGKLRESLTKHAIVVGAGHAGCEAAIALAKRKIYVTLVTMYPNAMATLPCNPSIGGSAKGIIVREIDALGGIMGRVADMSQIQSKMLNTGKGYAVRSLRYQIDRDLYSNIMTNIVKTHRFIKVIEGHAHNLIIENHCVCGVYVKGEAIRAPYVVLTTGTYLNSCCYIGNEKEYTGPASTYSPQTLSEQLGFIGLEIIRLKTGTPPRVSFDSIDYSLTKSEHGDRKTVNYNVYSNNTIYRPDYPCFLTHTTKQTKEIVLNNIKKSATYGGLISGIGPRYCPSIEDKMVKFPNETHQVFLEPDDLRKSTVYLQGLSTSLPRDIQEKILKSIPCLANAKIVKYAYAIEYDAVNPIGLKPTLETKNISNLYLAGQINGTSGYEEAACQGLVAGINIGNSILKLPPLVLGRDDAYIGVLIDDLVTKGTKEPYRMMTSASEFRLLLRHDNAAERLAHIAYANQMIPLGSLKKIKQKVEDIDNFIKYSKHTQFKPSKETIEKMSKYKCEAPNSPTTIFEYITRPQSTENFVGKFIITENKYRNLLVDIIIRIKYEGYIQKERKKAEQAKKYDLFKIPVDIDYSLVYNLSTEAREKLNKIRPLSIGQASRVIGIRPADINSLLYYIRENKDDK